MFKRIKHRHSVKRKNSSILYMLFAFFVFTSLGYAFLTNNLNISGISRMLKTTWDLSFENFTVTEGSVELAEDVVFDEKNITINFNAELPEPTNFYEFKVDIANKGTIGAVLENFTKTELTAEQQKFLSFTVTNIDGTPIEDITYIEAGKHNTIIARLEYIETADVVAPLEDQYINLNIKFDYTQDDNLPKDIIERIYKLARSDAFVDFSKEASVINGEGLLLKADTLNNENPICYYRGNIDSNNVLWANKCWKIIRTTSTGGIKMIYSGMPSGGKCNNTGSNTTTGSTDQFSSVNSLAGVGYMYKNDTKYAKQSTLETKLNEAELVKTATFTGYSKRTGSKSTSTMKPTIANGSTYTNKSTYKSTYKSTNKSTYLSGKSTVTYVGISTFTKGVTRGSTYTQISKNTSIYTYTYVTQHIGTFYGSSSVTYDPEAEKYSLTNYTNIHYPSSGYYTCGGSTTTCETVRYIYATDYEYESAYSSSLMLTNYDYTYIYSYIELTGGATYNSNNYQLRVCDDVSNLTETCQNVEEKNFLTNMSSYMGKFVCKDHYNSNDDSSCSNISDYRKVASKYQYESGTSYITTNYNYYATDYNFSNEITYSDGVYTLVNPVTYDWFKDTKNEYKNLHYTCLSMENTCDKINYIYDYIKNGTPTKMNVLEFSEGEIFTNEILNDMSISEVSSKIKTSNESWYSSNLETYQDSIEDVVYCNDRSTLGLDANSTFKYKVFDRYLNNDITLACENDKDRYSANTSVGNGKLTYPIGLITYDEAIMAGANFGSSYLTESINYWTMTPSYISYLFSIGTNGFENKKNTATIYNRPVISIKTDDLLIVKGDGTENNPFVLK